MKHKDGPDRVELRSTQTKPLVKLYSADVPSRLQTPFPSLAGHVALMLLLFA